MKPFTLTIERTRIESARVTVYARDEFEAEERGEELAEKDGVIWEDSALEISVGVEAPPEEPEREARVNAEAGRG